MVAARGRGLDTCPQAAFTPFHRIITERSALPTNEQLVCGMSLGVRRPDGDREHAASPSASRSRASPASSTDRSTDLTPRRHEARSILVCRRIFPDVLERLREHFEVEANDADDVWSRDELIAACRARPASSSPARRPIDAALLDACPRAARRVQHGGRLQQHRRAGVHRARRRWSRNAPDVLTETTADFGFALLMAAARRISRERAFPAPRRVDEVERRPVRRQRRARRDARHPRHGPDRPGDRAARRARLRHEGDLSQPLARSTPPTSRRARRALRRRARRCCARPTTWSSSCRTAPSRTTSSAPPSWR